LRTAPVPPLARLPLTAAASRHIVPASVTNERR
jgi:hypothetical protein